MIALDVERFAVVEVDDAGGFYFRTDGLGRVLHPEIAVARLPLEEAQAFLVAMVDRVTQGSYLDVPSGNLSWQGMSWSYVWKPEQFLFWFASWSHPSL